jgi:hypothetical protein
MLRSLAKDIQRIQYKRGRFSKIFIVCQVFGNKKIVNKKETSLLCGLYKKVFNGCHIKSDKRNKKILSKI